MHQASVMIQIVLASMFVLSSVIKFVRTASMVRHWREYRYPMWLMSVIGMAELLGAVSMLAALWIPGIAKYAAILFIILMLGAVHAHRIRAKHKPIMALNALLMLALSVVLLGIG
ncbi:DoxX family protein [Paenibacillus sp. 32352]|uniref:DoxX family protein n=1 Tax=Paenibacillus sp. 32352 TaxID=1969111 RepID=UPI0021197F62|nr:DoxX family protein [Paenibacillus sp. 32352]